MEEDYGKYYYATNPNCKVELVRLVDTIEEGGEQQVVCMVKLPILNTEAYVRWDSSYLKSNYASISPQLTTYVAVFKDAPIEDSLWLIIEPYDTGDGESTINRAFAINVYSTLIYKGESEDRVVSFDHHRHKDAFEFFRDMKGFKYAVMGSSFCAYYHDIAVGILRSFRHWSDDEISIYNATIGRIKKDCTAIVKIKGLKPNDTIPFYIGFRRLSTAVSYCARQLLNIVPLSRKAIDALKAFTQDRVLTETVELTLCQILDHESRGNTYLADIDDPILQSSLLVFDLTLKTDLDKVKNDNPLYTTVVVVPKPPTKKGKPYVIMYRRSPVEFRVPEQTGFSEQEMAKLLS